MPMAFFFVYLILMRLPLSVTGVTVDVGLGVTDSKVAGDSPVLAGRWLQCILLGRFKPLVGCGGTPLGRFRVLVGRFKTVSMQMSDLRFATLTWGDATTTSEGVTMDRLMTSLSVSADSRNATGGSGQKLSQLRRPGMAMATNKFKGGLRLSTDRLSIVPRGYDNS